MSREHLYKAKRVNWRELPKDEWWVEGHLTQRKDSYGKVFESWIVLDAYEQLGVLNMKSALVSEIDFNCYKVDPETICEYTQMTDKNRKRIFEGDIIKTDFYNQVYGYEKPDKSDLNIYKVYFNGITYCVKNKEKEFMLRNGSKGCEVIGNIFDNVELLKGDGAE